MRVQGGQRSLGSGVALGTSTRLAAASVTLSIALACISGCEIGGENAGALLTPSTGAPVDLLSSNASQLADALRARVAAGSMVRRALVVEAETSQVLALPRVAEGSSLRFELTPRGGRSLEGRLEIRLHTRGESAPLVLLERPLVSDAADRWAHVSIPIPSTEDSAEISIRVRAADGAGDLAVAVADLLLLPPTPPPGSAPPNLLIVSLDTLRADHLPLYGYARDTAPFLSELGQRLAVYEQAMSSSNWTLPAHASLFTGLHPYQHGSVHADAPPDERGKVHTGIPLRQSALTLAEILSERDMLAMGVVAGPYLHRRFGMDQGFALYSDQWLGLKRRGPSVTEHALAWVEEFGDRPFFLFLNYFDPHVPLDPEGYEGDDDEILRQYGIDIAKFRWNQMRDLGLRQLPEPLRDALVRRYDAEIRVVDDELRRLFTALEARSLLDHTLVVIVGDHGEAFGEHDTFGHGSALYQEEVRVPLLYGFLDSDAAGSRVSDPVGIVALPYWILRDLGLPEELGVIPEVAFAERDRGEVTRRMWRLGRFKYLVTERDRNGTLSRREELYDLSADPLERRSLVSDADPEVQRTLGRARELAAETLESMRAIREASPDTSGLDPLAREDEQLIQSLKALGYVE